MVLYGLNNNDQHNGKTPAKRFATDIFSKSFNMCLDKSVEEVNHDIKQYVTLTQNQGQIQIHPGTRQNIQAFMLWTRDMIRTRREPSLIPFPIQAVARLIRNLRATKHTWRNLKHSLKLPNLSSSRNR